MFDIHENDRYCELLRQGEVRNKKFLEKEKLRKEKLEEFKPILSILNDIYDKLNIMNDKINDIQAKVNDMYENKEMYDERLQRHGNGYDVSGHAVRSWKIISH